MPRAVLSVFAKDLDGQADGSEKCKSKPTLCPELLGFYEGRWYSTTARKARLLYIDCEDRRRKRTAARQLERLLNQARSG